MIMMFMLWIASLSQTCGRSGPFRLVLKAKLLLISAYYAAFVFNIKKLFAQRAKMIKDEETKTKEERDESDLES